MSRLIRMDHSGHTTLAEWTADDPARVEAAVAAFRQELDRGYFAMVSTGEERISQHDMGVIIAAAVVAYRPSLIPVVRHWADSAAGFPCGSAAQGVLR